MRAQVTVSQSGDISAIGAAIKDLKDAVVYVGIPEKGTERKRGFIGPQQNQSRYITNAALLYIHTNGSQLHKIPARPVIEPAIAANQLRIEQILGAAAQSYLDGKKREGNNYVKMAGQFASNASKLWFTDPRNGWQQNKPDVIRRKLGKMPSSRPAKKKWLAARNTVNVIAEKYRRRQLMLPQGFKNTNWMPVYGQEPALDAINTPLIDTAQLRRAITYVTKI